MFNKNPPKSVATRKHRDATAFATATDFAAAPMAMHMHVAQTLVNTNVRTNVTSETSVPSLRPIMAYVVRPKKNGGRTRMGSTSKSSAEIKYASTPYTPSALSRRNNKRSSLHTGKDDRLISVKYRSTKNSAPSLFCMPAWSAPTCRKMKPTPSAVEKEARKCTPIKNGCRKSLRSSRPHSKRSCLPKGAVFLRAPEGNGVWDPAARAATDKRNARSDSNVSEPRNAVTIERTSSSDERRTVSRT